jgi:hypothetical protein
MYSLSPSPPHPALTSTYSLSPIHTDLFTIPYHPGGGGLPTAPPKQPFVQNNLEIKVIWKVRKRSPSLVCLMGSSCQYERFLSCLSCSSQPSTRYFFLTIRFFTSFVPIAQQAGRQSCRIACFLICVSGGNPVPPEMTPHRTS